jgi:trk system potassium uptake protein TrkA
MKQFAVIGLGNFGHYLATRLYDKGHDVLAIDIDPARIQEIKDGVSQAVVADGTDRRAIEPLGIKEMDAAVVSVGSDLGASILTTLTLKDIGIKRVISKAITEPQGRILLKVGASEIIFPEKDSAVSLAERMDNPNIIDYLPFIEGYSIIELTPPEQFVGKALKDLNLINEYGVQVVAIKETVPENINLIPTGNFVLKESDIMILLGANDGLNRLRKSVS